MAGIMGMAGAKEAACIGGVCIVGVADKLML